jgi:hypothetical protein
MKVLLALFLLFALSAAQQNTTKCISDLNTIVEVCQSIGNPSPIQILEYIPILGYALYEADADCGLEQDLEFLANPEFEIAPISFAVPQCDEDIENLIKAIASVIQNPPTGEIATIDTYVGLFEYLNAAFLDCNALDAPEMIIEDIIQAAADGELANAVQDVANQLIAAYPDAEQYYQDFESNVASLASQAGEDIEGAANQAGSTISNTANQAGEDIENIFGGGGWMSNMRFVATKLASMYKRFVRD